MTPEEHVYASIRSNPNNKISDYCSFTKLNEREVVIAISQLEQKQKVIYDRKSGWRVK